MGKKKSKDEFKSIHQPTKNLIYLGCKDEKIIKDMEALYPEHVIFVLDDDMYNRVTEMIVRKQANWKEEQSILEFKTKLENIQRAMTGREMVRQIVEKRHGEDKMFYMKDLVDGGSFTYVEAADILELLYIFSMVAKKTLNKREVYIIIDGLDDKIEYVDLVIQDKTKELETLKLVYDNMVTQRAVNASKVSKELPKTELKVTVTEKEDKELRESLPANIDGSKEFNEANNEDRLEDELKPQIVETNIPKNTEVGC